MREEGTRVARSGLVRYKSVMGIHTSLVASYSSRGNGGVSEVACAGVGTVDGVADTVGVRCTVCTGCSGCPGRASWIGTSAAGVDVVWDAGGVLAV